MSHVRKKAHGAAARFAGNQPEVKGDRGNSGLKRTIPGRRSLAALQLEGFERVGILRISGWLRMSRLV